VFDELILVRHAQSVHHATNLTGGWTDSSLTELGRAQAERTAQRLATEIAGAACTVLTSDLRRASETATIIANALKVQPTADARLRELNNGKAAGLTWPQARLIELPRTEPILDWIPYPEAESWRMMTSRVWQYLDSVSQQISGTAVVVTHGHSGNASIHWWLGLTEEYWTKCSFRLDAGSISRFKKNEWGERSIELLNDTSHFNK